MRAFRTLCCLALILLASGCGSLHSTKVGQHAVGEGLVYYLPKKDVLITITVSGGGDGSSGEESQKTQVTSIEIGTTTAYPDLANAFILRRGRQAFGDNQLDIGVSESGLLQSTNSTYTSQTLTAFKEAARAAATVATVKSAPEDSADICPPGTHTFLLRIAEGEEGFGSDKELICGLSGKVAELDNGGEPHFEDVKSSTLINTGNGPQYEQTPAIFYRQSLPYKVSIKADNSEKYTTNSIVFSPNLSRTLALPISKSFFGDNTAELTFQHGIPTQFNQTKESEAVGLLKLPAEIVAAYFQAVGSVFDSFKATDTSESAQLDAGLDLKLKELKYQACLDAIRNEDLAKIEELECGQ